MLCVQFGILERNTIREEQKQLEELLYLREKQFEASRENMELINIKCHYLKHWFQKIQTLDTILTEKKMYCEYNRIRLTCMAKGESLDFLTTAEICFLFGNIIDNAIEAVMKIEDENSREISLSIRRREMLLSIHEENYYAVEPVKRGENFETSKEDQTHHGFGIRMIVENHHGDMEIIAKDGGFNLNILLSISP